MKVRYVSTCLQPLCSYCKVECRDRMTTGATWASEAGILIHIKGGTLLQTRQQTRRTPVVVLWSPQAHWASIIQDLHTHVRVFMCTCRCYTHYTVINYHGVDHIKLQNIFTHLYTFRLF